MADTKNTNKCPKCGGEMEEGMIADKTSQINISTEQNWGTKKKFAGFGGLENEHEVMTFRCVNCGFLESYAK